MASKVSVRKHGAGWQWRFEGAPIDGKRKQYSKGGFRTAKEARAAGMIAWNEYNQAGEVRTLSEMSFSDYLNLWLDKYGTNLKSTTIKGYQKRIDTHIRPALGKYKLLSLTPSVMQGFINKLFDSGLSRNTISSIKGILTGSLSYAVEPLHLLLVSPMGGVKMPSTRATPKTPETRHPHSVITPQKMALILSRFPEGTSPYIPLLLGYYCGLRLGEAYGLTWDDIDFDCNTIQIRRQVQMSDDKKHWMFTPPKYESYRTIKMSQLVRDALQKRWKVLSECREMYGEFYHQITVDDRNLLDSGDGTPVNLVNVRENGTYIQPRTMMDASRVIHYELGVREFTYHSLRHTHATQLIAAGAHPKAVQERLGHKNLSVTLNIYAHNTPELSKQLEKTLEILDAPPPD